MDLTLPMDVRRDTDIETLYQSLTASNYSIPDLVNRKIYGRSPHEQVEILVSFLDSSAELDERLAAFSNVIYGKLRLHDFYLHKYESLESFHEVVDYDKSIAPRIVLHNENEQRKGNLLKAVEQNWKCPIATLFPGQLPTNLSQRLLRSLKELSELPDVSRSEAIALVKEQIAARIAESKEVGRAGGRLYSNIITVRDVEETSKILLGTHQKNPPAEPEVYFNSTTVRPLSGMVGSNINAPIRTVTPVDDSEVIVTSLARNSGNLRKRTHSVASLERASGNSTPSDRSVSLRALDPAVSTVESTDIASGFECSNSTRNMSSTGVLADATLSIPATGSRCNTDAVIQTAPISHSHESTSCCDCTPFHRIIVSEQLASKLHTHPNDENAVFRTIEDAVNAPESLGGICFIHLRHMATSLKLNNSMEGASRPELEYRLRYCLKNKQRLSSVRKLYGHWFHSSARTDSVRRKLGSAKYAPSPITAIEVDQRRLWEKYGRPGAMEEWEQNGTINIENIFDYVLKDDDAMAMVHTEFAMYEYHYHASGDPGSHKGWLRNMWYSLIQQLVRMDPVYYLITVASRPDSNTWLISYPYYTKSTAPGHETGFLHLDLHAEQFVQDGKGGNITQGAVTLTDEDDDNCTVLVPGFHRQIRAWVKDNLAIKRRKGQGHNTHAQNRVQTGTTGVKQGAWTSEMARKYGDLIPVPNKAGGVRISRPDILHGSTGKASIVRRVVFPWFTGIRPDHSTLDNIESETWEQLALCHLQRIPCKLSPSGKSVSSRTTSNIEQIFRASVELQYPDSSTYPIGRALLGKERWDDYEVVQMQGVLFGNDDTAADTLICDIRAKLVKGLKISFQQLIKKEKLVYGQKSFFAYTELSKKSLPSYPPPPADRDSDVESLAELTCSGNSDAGLSCEESDEDM